MEQNIVISDLKQAATRLDVYLTENLEDWTRSQIKKQIDNGGAFINGKVAKAGNIVKYGDTISISFNREIGLDDVLPEDIPLNIVYEDEDILVVNKAQGMVVHPAPGNYTHTLVNALLFYLKNNLSNSNSVRPGIVHRIDKDTSGLLVVAKNNESHISLAEQIAKHTCRRTYIALLEGNLKTDKGTITTYLNRSPSDRKKYVVSDTGKLAITHYEVITRYEGYTLCRFVLETGRTHQIRVHSKHLGHPIVGDKTYGFAKQKFNLDGQLLHAVNLELDHPRTNEKLLFSAEIPDYFQSTLKKIKKI